MQPLPHTRSCFVCGEANPIGLQLRFETDGKVVRAEFCPKPEPIGFKGTVHGGIIATLLDETMVWAGAIQTKRFAYCAELNVRYVLPVRPGVTVIASAELVENRRGKVFATKGELRDRANVLLVTATAKYLPVPGELTVDLLTDFVGDVRFLTSGET
jgi:uncharacterized protein (TIGR00369 family)